MIDLLHEFDFNSNCLPHLHTKLYAKFKKLRLESPRPYIFGTGFFPSQVEALHLEKRALDRRIEFSQEELVECERQLKVSQVKI